MSDFLKFFFFFFPLLDSPMLLLSYAPNQPHTPAGTSLPRRADFLPAPAITCDASLCNRLQTVTCLFLLYYHTVSSVCKHCNPVILFCSTAAVLVLFILFLFSIFWIFWVFLFFFDKVQIWFFVHGCMEFHPTIFDHFSNLLGSSWVLPSSLERFLLLSVDVSADPLLSREVLGPWRLPGVFFQPGSQLCSRLAGPRSRGEMLF